MLVHSSVSIFNLWMFTTSALCITRSKRSKSKFLNCLHGQMHQVNSTKSAWRNWLGKAESWLQTGPLMWRWTACNLCLRLCSKWENDEVPSFRRPNLELATNREHFMWGHKNFRVGVVVCYVLIASPCSTADRGDCNEVVSSHCPQKIRLLIGGLSAYISLWIQSWVCFLPMIGET